MFDKSDRWEKRLAMHRATLRQRLRKWWSQLRKSSVLAKAHR